MLHIRSWGQSLFLITACSYHFLMPDVLNVEVDASGLSPALQGHIAA